MVHSVTEVIPTDLFSRKKRKLYVTYSAESNVFGYPIEDNIKGESNESFDVSDKILGFSLQTRELMWGITGELPGN